MPSSPPGALPGALPGVRRRVRLGWSAAVVGAGVAVAATSLVAGSWVRVRSYDYSSTEPSTERHAALLDVVGAVRDVRGTDPDAPDPGALADLFFPGLAIGLLVLCAVLAVLAVLPLPRRGLRLAVRAAAGVALIGTSLVSVLAFESLGWTYGAEEAPVINASAADLAGTSVWPDGAGVAMWGLGLALVVAGALVGPRTVVELPEGVVRAGLPPGARRATHWLSVVLAALGALLALVGYLAASWATEGDTVTFADIGEVARDTGFDDAGLAQAYFAGLGWGAALAGPAAVLLLALGLKPVASAGSVKALGLLASGGALVLHVLALVDLDADSYGPAPLLIGFGLALVAFGAALPLRTVVPRPPSYAGPPPGWGGPPPGWGGPPPPPVTGS